MKEFFLFIYIICIIYSPLPTSFSGGREESVDRRLKQAGGGGNATPVEG